MFGQSKPRPVAKIVTSFSSMVDELNARAELMDQEAAVHQSTIEDLRQKRLDCMEEAEKASIIAKKITQLVA